MRRKRLFIYILATLVLVLGPGLFVDLANADDDAYVPGEVLVMLFQALDLAAVATQYNLKPEPLDQFGSRPIYRLGITDGALPLDRASQLKTDPRVAFAEANYIAQTPEGRKQSSWVIGADDGREYTAGDYTSQWAHAKLGLAAAHSVTEGDGIRIAVLDTGVDPAHPALQGRLEQGRDFVDDDTDPREEGARAIDAVYGHGTHVAGLIALTAPRATILPVRVLDRSGEGNLWVLTEGLLYAIDPDGDPATDDGADVINLSLGTYRETELLENLIEDINCDRGDECPISGGKEVVVVAAAGNSGTMTPEYPAAEGEVPGLVAVAATTEQDTLADFSTRGPWIGIAAPGDGILSSVPGGKYVAWSGTSMAAPFVAGTAALVRARFPELTAAETVAWLTLTGVNIGAGVPPRLDAAAATGALELPTERRVLLPTVMR